jgi:hypothetical protein
MKEQYIMRKKMNTVCTTTSHISNNIECLVMFTCVWCIANIQCNNEEENTIYYKNHIIVVNKKLSPGFDNFYSQKIKKERNKEITLNDWNVKRIENIYRRSKGRGPNKSLN